jgi:predicted nucleic acid-binding protein
VIVVDTNVIAYLYLPGAHASAVEALLARDPDWAAPLLWRSEFRNILAGYLRRGALTFEQAIAIQAEAKSLLSGREYDVESGRVLELVHASDCSAYDCEFVSLAITLGSTLVTADKQLLKAFPAYARPLHRA